MLTNEQIRRQDWVDNQIHELCDNVIPHDKFDGNLEWDIALIGGVRDIIGNYLVKKGVCTDAEFYPHI